MFLLQYAAVPLHQGGDCLHRLRLQLVPPEVQAADGAGRRDALQKGNKALLEGAFNEISCSTYGIILIITLGSMESDKSMAKKAISPSPASAKHRPSASQASKGIKRVFRSREEGFLHRRQSSKFLCIIYFSLMYFLTIPQLLPEKLRRLCPHGGAVGRETCLQRRRAHFCQAAIFFRRKDEQRNPRGLSLTSDDRPRRFLQLLLRATFTFVILWCGRKGRQVAEAGSLFTGKRDLARKKYSLTKNINIVSWKSNMNLCQVFRKHF